MFLISRKAYRAAWISIILLFNACSSTQTTGYFSPLNPQYSIIKSPTDSREYASIVLPNQLQVVLVSDPSVEKSAVAMSVAVGSLQEPKEFGGLAHYLEHMLLLGTASFPEVNGLSDFVSAHGGTHNAYTELNHTNYMLTVNNAAFEQALARFSGLFFEALLDPAYADKERQAVHSEWTMNRTNDWVVLEQLSGSTLNPEHPISQFNWGNVNSLTDNQERSLQGALKDLYRTYYSANLMKAVVISPLSIAEMTNLAHRHFANIPNKQTPRPSITVPVAQPQHLKKLIRYLPQTDMKQLRIQFVIKNNANQFAVKPNTYVRYLLSNEMPGTLAAELRNSGLSQSVYASYDANEYSNAGSFTLYIDLTESGRLNRDHVMAAVLKYLALIREQGVDRKYYQEIKTSLQNAFRFKEQTNDYDYAAQIAANLQHFPAKYVLSHAYEYQRFDPQAIQQVLDQLTLDNARIVYIDKEQSTNQTMEHFAGHYSVEKITAEMQQTWLNLSTHFALALPRVNSLMPESFDLVSPLFTGQPQPLVQEKGLSIHLGHSAKFEQPKGSILLDFNSRFTQQSAKHYVLSQLYGLALQEQLLTLQTEAGAGGMGLGVHLANGLFVSVSGFTDKHAPLLNAVMDTVRHLTLDQNQFENLKHSVKARIENNQKVAPFDQLFPRLNQMLYLDSFSSQSQLAAIDKVILLDLNHFATQLLQHANLRVLAYGNYSPLKINNLSNLMLQHLPKERVEAAFYHSPVLPIDAGAIYSWQQDVDLQDNGLLDMSLLPRSPENLAAARILTKLVNPALYKQIRTEEQLAYALDFFGHTFKDHMVVGHAIQSPTTGLAQLGERIQSFRSAFVEQLLSVPPTTFDDTKQGVLLTLSQPAKNLSEELSPLIDDWAEQREDFSSKARLIAAIKQVTLDDVIKLYKQIEAGDDFTRILIQMRGSEFTHQPYFEPKGTSIFTDIDSFQQQVKQ